MSLKNNNIFNNVNIRAFAKNISLAVEEAVEKYWESNMSVVLQAINDYKDIRNENLIKNIDFFSSQVKVEKHKPIIIRLSKESIKNFLDISLSISSTNFLLTSLTPLEIKILNNFCDFLYKKLDEILIPTAKLKLSEKSEKNINFLLNAKFRNNKSAFILFSIPLDRIPFEEIKKVQSFSDEDFLTSKTMVRIRAGNSKITLDELQNLYNGDIVLLEESNVSQMVLISGDFEKPFSVKKNTSIILDLDVDEEEEINEQNSDEVIMEKNLWDDIQIEISAEFEKVKMTIGELKQITQGQIVDLGSVFDNEISLYVENKKVAKGELVIINDRYAVCLKEVLSTAPKVQQKPQGATVQSKQSVPTSKPQPAQVQRPIHQKVAKPIPTKKPSQDEEFDYSDFEK